MALVFPTSLCQSMALIPKWLSGPPGGGGTEDAPGCPPPSPPAIIPQIPWRFI